MQPLVLVCTIHSLANGIIDLVIKKQFKEKRKIQIFATNQSNKQKQSFVHTTFAGQNQKFIWNSKGQINYHKSKLFNYLLSKIWPEYLDKPKRKKLWEVFKSKKELKENVVINALSTPYCHYDIDYSLFLTEAKLEFSQDKELLIQLEKNCRQDKEKNVWLDYEDIITNALSFIEIKNKKIWPEFDYILVDECQDLKKQVLNLVIKIFGNEQTGFTFVGDPKQNIMGFAGATEDIFELLEQEFPNLTRNTISLSFRLPQEIAAFANNFITKFMPYRDNIETIKSNDGQKPQIFIVGQDQEYQLSKLEEKEIKQEVSKDYNSKKNSNSELEAKKLEKLSKDAIKKEIRTKKLKKQLDFILPIINKLDKSASKAILYRKNWIGELLQEWLQKNDNYDFITTGSETIANNIIRKVRNQIKTNSFLNFKLLKDWLDSLEAKWTSIPQLEKIVTEIDKDNLKADFYLTEEKINNFINKIKEELLEKDLENSEGILLSTIHGVKGLEFDHVFLIFCDKKVLPDKEKFTNSWGEREEKNLFFTAITRPKEGLYITTSSNEECSNFISDLSSDLVDLKKY